MVRWRDAHFDFDQREPRADYIVTTVGYLIGQNERWLSIAGEVLPNGDGYRAVTHVPKTSLEGDVERLYVGGTMPVQKAKGGYRFGTKGKVYKGKGAKAKAVRQGRAIKASQARRKGG